MQLILEPSSLTDVYGHQPCTLDTITMLVALSQQKHFQNPTRTFTMIDHLFKERKSLNKQKNLYTNITHPSFQEATHCLHM